MYKKLNVIIIVQACCETTHTDHYTISIFFSFPFLYHGIYTKTPMHSQVLGIPDHSKAIMQHKHSLYLLPIPPFFFTSQYNQQDIFKLEDQPCVLVCVLVCVCVRH